MNETQYKIFEILTFFDKFCRENKLTYFCIGGTCLGMARHNGFIPWDDDIDVGMPLEDYLKLKELADGRIFDRFLIEFCGRNKEFVTLFAKIFDTKTTQLTKSRYTMKRGIYLDIFPLVGVGNDIKEARLNQHKITKLHNLYLCKVCSLRKGRRWYKNLGIILLRYNPFLSRKIIQNKIFKLVKEKSFYNYNYVTNPFGHWQDKECIEKKFFGNGIQKQFEMHNFIFPENYDQYLTSVYGDWRKLPPKDKQKPEHDYVYMDLNTPFLNI